MALPEPAELIFLSQLDSFSFEKKVRFLGCVKHYDSLSNSLYLSHEYPRKSYQIVARVNLDLVLEFMNSENYHQGSWLNITGYTTGRISDPIYQFHTGDTRVYSEVSVRSVMLWNAVSLDIPKYEKILEARLKATESV